jgi:hypothetical protein
VDKVRKATGVAMSHVVVPGDDARAISAASALPLVMVVATEAVGAEALATAVRTRADAEPARFAVIAPLDLPEPRWGAEATELRRQAGEAMTATINALVDTGVAVEGQVMDDGPATALPLVIQAYRPARIVVAGVNGEARGLAEAATAAAGDIPVDTVNLGATAGA